MTPLAFDAETARHVVGDAESRTIEAKARTDADADRFDPPRYVDGCTYWDAVTNSMRVVVYREQFRRRKARLERKAAKDDAAPRLRT